MEIAAFVLKWVLLTVAVIVVVVMAWVTITDWLWDRARRRAREASDEWDIGD